jgi:hypothetical protein
VFAGDIHYVPPLRTLESRRLDRKKNPFFRFADVQMFVAYDQAGTPVGRISAQIKRQRLDSDGELTGHFGFFDTVHDPEVAAALLDVAATWLRQRGMRRIEGPYNFSINEECGMLVDGFDVAPAVMMGHARPWQSHYLEAFGMLPSAELLAFRLRVFEPPEQLAWLADSASSDPRISVRSFDRRTLDAELTVMVDIFNDAWCQNWGFVPLEKTEIDYMIGDLRPFFRGHFGKFVCIEGEPVGFMLGLPNLNEMIAGFGGRLLPFNWINLGTKMLFGHFDSGRIPLLGMRRAYQGSLRGTQLFAAMVRSHLLDLQHYRDAYTARTGKREGGFMELSWVLASNRPMVTFLRSLMGAPVKTYRIYGCDLAS